MPNAKFLLEIISPEGEIFKEEVNEAILPTTEGEIAVLPYHAPIFTKLIGGEITVKNGTKNIFIAITGGFLEINNNQVNVLADYAVKSENIEVVKAEQARKKAEELFKQKEKMSEVDFSLAEKELQRSILELKVSERVRKRNRG